LSKLIYSMMTSLDGFIETPNRSLDWVLIDEELHRFANDEARSMGAFLYGRGLYQAMTYWQTADADPAIPDYMREFAMIWKEKPKVVFSRTLEHVIGNSRLVRDNAADEVARLKSESSQDLSVGGPHLASTMIEAGLVDEFRVMVNPVVLGAGTPFLGAGHDAIKLRLIENRTFRSGVVFMRYERTDH
jgi:dihydrofolate reductase